jgi:hypothetical protein
MEGGIRTARPCKGPEFPASLLQQDDVLLDFPFDEVSGKRYYARICQTRRPFFND